ncbi:MAG: hypothetical protein WD749_11390 [Phycisphaerales bacterium]
MQPTPQILAEIEAMLGRGESEAARSKVQGLLRRSPADPALNAFMARALARLGQAGAAEYYAERAHRALPADPLLMALYGRALCMSGKQAEAVELLRRALLAAPGLPAAWLPLIVTHYQRGEMAAALAACDGAERAGVQNPELPELRAGAHLECGEPEAAVRALEEGLRRWPGHPRLLSHLCCAMNYSPATTPAAALARAREYGAALDRGLPRLPPAAPSPGGAGKKLTIGFVSPDLRVHSVAWFLEPLLERLDRGRFAVFCYHVGTAADGVSQRLKALSRRWRHIPHAGPTDLAKQLRADGVDIAVDLAGHTDGHRLAAFHVGCAPVQATWLGYPSTTGVRGIGLRLVDSLTDPPVAAAQATERLARLDPCFVCYRPDPGAPPLRMPEGGGIVFGSFSAMAKVNDRCAALWARVLARVPGSRLLLKNWGLREAGVRERVRARLAAAGIPAERLELAPWAEGTGEHLAMYGRMHVALDTWPYGGTTTTCEALWMGVPVVTLVGESHASRVGASLLSAAGLPDCITRTDDDYVEAAARLAGDAAGLATLRGTLRERVAASPLCDAGGFAGRFGAALREGWESRTLGG